MTKSNIIMVLITVLVVVGGIFLMKMNRPDNSSSTDSSNTGWASNVVVTNGKQQITISAGNGYFPKMTIAKADIPTTLIMQWKNAYGCESAVRIPQLAYTKNLEANESDTITIPAQKAWSTINGTCGMGMYNFQIMFE